MKIRYRIIRHNIFGDVSTELQMKKGWFSFWKTIDYCPPQTAPYSYQHSQSKKYTPNHTIKIVDFTIIS